MSRASRQDTQNAVQLFPFVAVLLCTMGSLLVLLIVITRSSKVHALEAAAAAQAKERAAVAAQAEKSRHTAEEAQRQLEKVAKYQAELDSVHAQAAQQLHQDQERLSHLEDHMRRLREQLETLQLAAAELNGLEGEHYDDQKQAQLEIERLQKLIEESRKTIEDLRASAKRAKSYAIVPYQGRNGTVRRPVYIECREKEVVLQPEGIVFTEDDFRPPVGPGNALVAAIRAAREHIIQYESTGLSGQQAEPYPLIVVRPKGIGAYYCVREAIQSWDDEFGYELVEEDWDLKYSPPNPQLAAKEFEAAELARRRLRALAEAAPQAYGAYRAGNGFGNSQGAGDDDERVDEPYGESGLASGPRVGDARFASGAPDKPVNVGTVGPAGARAGAGYGDSASGTDGATDGRYAGGQAAGSTGPQPNSQPSVAAATGQPGTPGDQPPPLDEEQNPARTSASGSYVAGEDPELQLDNMARASAAGNDGDDAQDKAKPTPTKVRGKNWAIANGQPGMIPIRRSIQIVVRDDALAILPEASSTNEASAAGREFPFANAPEAAYDDLLTAVEKRIKDWGIAGQGLYWRPVVELRVGANGEHRVDDLTRLLKYSGVEIRGVNVAQHDEGGTINANR